jgi:hypothetical protein
METIADLRKELDAAIANVRRQIDVLATSPGGLPNGSGPSGDALANEALEQELAQLEEALANLDSDNGQESGDN